MKKKQLMNKLTSLLTEKIR